MKPLEVVRPWLRQARSQAIANLLADARRVELVVGARRDSIGNLNDGSPFSSLPDTRKACLDTHEEERRSTPTHSSTPHEQGERIPNNKYILKYVHFSV